MWFFSSIVKTIYRVGATRLILEKSSKAPSHSMYSSVFYGVTVFGSAPYYGLIRGCPLRAYLLAPNVARYTQSYQLENSSIGGDRMFGMLAVFGDIEASLDFWMAGLYLIWQNPIT